MYTMKKKVVKVEKIAEVTNLLISRMASLSVKTMLALHTQRHPDTRATSSLWSTRSASTAVVGHIHGIRLFRCGFCTMRNHSDENTAKTVAIGTAALPPSTRTKAAKKCLEDVLNRCPNHRRGCTCCNPREYE